MQLKTSFWKTNVGKALIAGAYASGSALASYFVTETVNQPELFGQFTVIINLVAVLIVKTLSNRTPNIGS